MQNTALPNNCEKRTYTVSEIQEILNIGRNSAYELVKTASFKSIMVGRVIRISKKSFDEWLDANEF
ncbi:MAG: DNA-binding protein [Clostridia bacterium]|nr:DNA-binding protein [Clostridia bacterium]